MISDEKRGPEVFRREHIAAMVHIEFLCKLSVPQIDAGWFFLHEHPATLASWKEEPIEGSMAH